MNRRSFIHNSLFTIGALIIAQQNVHNKME